MAEWRIPLSPIDAGDEERMAVEAVLDRGWWSMGPETKSFEEEFEDLVGGDRRAVAVANGTAALHCALVALEVGEGDEVVQPALNFVAAANMTIAAGATPVFADIESELRPVIDPDDAERRITSRTKAVVVMHYGGHLSDVARLKRVCDGHGVALIEDASHAVGAVGADGVAAGSYGEAGCFSFYSNKNLATGEGGMIVVPDEKVARRVRLLRSHGMSSLAWDRFAGGEKDDKVPATYDVTLHGFNYRIDDIRSAIGRVQLRKLESGLETRRTLVNRYLDRLRGSETWELPFFDRREETSDHLMVALAADTRARDATRVRLAQTGIQTSLHYPLVTQFAAFKDVPAGGLERSEAFASRALTLPLSPAMSLDEVDAVCDAMAASGA